MVPVNVYTASEVAMHAPDRGVHGVVRTCGPATASASTTAAQAPRHTHRLEGAPSIARK